MVTEEPSRIQFNEFQQYEVVTNHIIHTFQLLIDHLIVRRDLLLNKLFQIKEIYTNKEATRVKAIQELENTFKQLQEMSLKENENIPIHQKAAQVYQEGLFKLESPNKLPYPLFQCQTLKTLQTAVSEFGDVLEWEVPNYSLKEEPILTAGKKRKEKNELDFAGLFLDEDTQQVYIADFENKRIQVMSVHGEFSSTFGKNVLRQPWGIAVNKNHIFVTDAQYCSIFQFCKNTLELIDCTKGSDESQLNEPLGICIDNNGDVYVADNHKICIFSIHLKFKSTFGTEILYFPQDVKLTLDCIVVLDKGRKSVHFFSRKREYLKSCVLKRDNQLNNPQFFCLDLAGNIIISNYGNHSIKIFTSSGQFIHSIEMVGKQMEFIEPYGISVSRKGFIFVASKNVTYSLQCF